MAALDFPSSPTNGQTYTSGSRSWIYNSTLGAWEGGSEAITAALLGITGSNTGDETAARIASALNAGTVDSSAADSDRIAVTSPAGGYMTLTTLWTWIKSKIDAGLTWAGSQTFSGQMELTGQAATNATSAMTRALVDSRSGFAVTSSTARTRTTQNVYTDDEDLQVALAANSAYYFKVRVNATHATSSSLGMRMYYGGTITGTGFMIGATTVSQTGSSTQLRWTTVTAGSVTEANSSTGNSMVIEGIILTGTAGTLTTQIANAAATGTMTRTAGIMTTQKL